MTKPTELPLVLASSSRYRRQLLERLGLSFTCCAPEIDETRLSGESIPALCSRLAEAKAKALSGEFPGHILIGCDQSAAVGDHQLEKPGNFDNALIQLKKLSGQTVVFYTAVAVFNVNTRSLSSAIDATEVQVRQLDAAAITRYLEAERPFDCAGSFKVEGLGISLFEKVAGDDPSALIGLPLIALCRLLRAQGIVIP